MNHEQAQALLPWHVADTLSSNESKALDQHAQHCAQCQADIALFAGVRRVTAVPQSGEPVYRPEILAEVVSQLPSITQELSLEPVPEYRATKDAAAWWRQFRIWPNRLTSQLSAATARWFALPSGARWVMATQAALLVGVLGVNSLMGTGGESVGGDDQTYVTVSGSTGNDTADFAIAFKPGMAEADMRDLLLGSGIRLVGGPNTLGMYQIALPPGGDANAVTERLTANEWVIYLEPVTQP